MGAKGWTIFTKVTFPHIKWAFLYGVVLCTARAMGQFGAVSVPFSYTHLKVTAKKKSGSTRVTIKLNSGMSADILVTVQKGNVSTLSLIHILQENQQKLMYNRKVMGITLWEIKDTQETGTL